MSQNISIPFNKPYLTGKETHYINEAVKSGKISGNGIFTQKAHSFFSKQYGFGKCLLTSSCTDALEMAAILLDIGPGDEIIMPSYTFVSTANAFVLRGATIIFADSRPDHPGIDEQSVDRLVTKNTKAIVVVHYGGVACNMDIIMGIAKKHNLFVVEDAAQAIDSYYVGEDGVKKALGSIGHFSAFSFHETKNIISGEGGMLVINDARFEKRSEIIWEKGTNRSAFFRGEVDKYGWVDIGSSFLPSEITAAFLWAQLEHIESIQTKRLELWSAYRNAFIDHALEGYIQLPFIPDYASNNAHVFYIVCKTQEQRRAIISALSGKKILSVFHYQSLHKSEFYKANHDSPTLKFSDFYSDTLLRLPLYFELEVSQVNQIVDIISTAVKSHKQVTA